MAHRTAPLYAEEWGQSGRALAIRDAGAVGTGYHPLYDSAWRILWMTYQVRIDPDQSPTVAFSADEIDALERIAAAQSPARRSGQPFTLQDAVRAMAKLGGFLGRKSDGEPGVKTLWRGYRQLQLICWGIQLARQAP